MQCSSAELVSIEMLHHFQDGQDVPATRKIGIADYRDNFTLRGSASSPSLPVPTPMPTTANFPTPQSDYDN